MNKKWLAFSGILVGMSTSALMQTLVATSLPVIERELGGIRLYTWVFAGYMLASTITIPLFGRLADLIGRRTLYISGLMLFLVASALVGQARSMVQLVAFRVIQGIGAGTVAPAALAAIGDLFGEQERGKIFGIIGAVQVLANLIGPPLGGWITDTFSWRWSFYLVLPIGVVALLLTWIGLDDKTQLGEWRNLSVDWIGAFGIGAALCAGLVGLQWVGAGDTQFTLGILLVILAVVMLVFSLRWERNHPDPVMPIALLRHPSMWKAALGTLLLGLITNSAIAYFPLYLEKIHAQSATETGFALIPMLLLAGIGSGLGGALANRWLKQTHIAAWILVSLGFVGLTLTNVKSIFWMASAIGGGMGLLLPIYLELAQSAGGDEYLATASGLVQLARNLGGAMGIPLLGIWLLKGESNPLTFTSIFATLTLVGLLGLVLAVAGNLSTKRYQENDNCMV